MNQNQHLHEVAITAIIVKSGKYLITRRAATKKRFPGMWTVPGGKLETSDYSQLPKDTEHYWYNVLERTLKREVMLQKDELEDYIRSTLSSIEKGVHADGSFRIQGLIEFDLAIMNAKEGKSGVKIYVVDEGDVRRSEKLSRIRFKVRPYADEGKERKSAGSK